MNNNIPKTIFHTIQAALFCISLYATGATAAITQIDKIIALVNDDVITLNELDRETANILVQLKQKSTSLPPEAVLRKQVLERLIMKKLQLAAAKQSGITVGEDVLAQALNNIAHRNNLSISAFKGVLEKQGINFNTYREDIRSQILLSRLQQQVIRKQIKVSEQEIDQFLAQHQGNAAKDTLYHLSHILIATPEGASPEQIGSAKKRAEALVTQLRGGADFKALAVAESRGKKALEGGDLGWRNGNQLPSLFADIIKEMKPGEISAPLHSSSGFHIIKLNETRGGKQQLIGQTHIRHILIRTSEVTSDRDAKSRLEQLKLRIEAGDDFASLARSHSDDKSSAINGGDLGWMTENDLFPEFNQAIARLDVNQLSEPVRTELGWHLVQVLGRRQQDITNNLQRNEAKNAILKRKLEDEQDIYLRRLRDEAYVDIRLEQ